MIGKILLFLKSYLLEIHSGLENEKIIKGSTEYSRKKIVYPEEVHNKYLKNRYFDLTVNYSRNLEIIKKIYF